MIIGLLFLSPFKPTPAPLFAFCFSYGESKTLSKVPLPQTIIQHCRVQTFRRKISSRYFILLLSSGYQQHNRVFLLLSPVDNHNSRKYSNTNKSCSGKKLIMLLRGCFQSMVVSSFSISASIRWRGSFCSVYTSALRSASVPGRILYAPRPNLAFSFCSIDHSQSESSKQGALKPGLYLVATPIGNLEDITLRALRVLKSADVILSEDTRHSGKLLQHYSISTPLLSYHKFNETQREQRVLKRLKDGEIVALISDAGTPGISDPGTELAKLCVSKGIPVIPIPGPSALVTALSASGLSTNEFAFVGFLPKHAGSRKERLLISANEAATQIFFVPPHKFSQFLEEINCLFGASRQCVMAREMTKVHEEIHPVSVILMDDIVDCIETERCYVSYMNFSRLGLCSLFWRGTVKEAQEAFSTNQPKGEITFIIEGKTTCVDEIPSESELENDLREMISKGNSLSEAVKLVAAGTSVRKKTIYSIALRKFGNQFESEDN